MYPLKTGVALIVNVKSMWQTWSPQRLPIFLLILLAIGYLIGSILATLRQSYHLFDATEKPASLNTERLKLRTFEWKRQNPDFWRDIDESPLENSEYLTKPLCDEDPLDLGPIPANKTYLELRYVEKKYPALAHGVYAPPNCTARHKVAIVVPYRDRKRHLAIFLNHMHNFLMKQHIEYGIFIVEQAGDKPFNRAKLMNVGFVESYRLYCWQCFIFHDIDLLPLDTRNMYSCPKQPRHMSAAVDTLNYKLPYYEIFGGVSALTLEQFIMVNGFSNKYWGWGREDDDMFIRIEIMGYHLARYKMSIARYAMLQHRKAVPNPQRYKVNTKLYVDGLSTLDYEVLNITRHKLYIHILANIDERS